MKKENWYSVLALVSSAVMLVCAVAVLFNSQYIVSIALFLLALNVIALNVSRNRVVRGARMLGWMQGRSALIHSMNEAQRRGMAVDDWLTAELERDLVMLKDQYPEGLPDE